MPVSHATATTHVSVAAMDSSDMEAFENSAQQSAVGPAAELVPSPSALPTLGAGALSSLEAAKPRTGAAALSGACTSSSAKAARKGARGRAKGGGDVRKATSTKMLTGKARVDWQLQRTGLGSAKLGRIDAAAKARACCNCREGVEWGGAVENAAA